MRQHEVRTCRLQLAREKKDGSKKLSQERRLSFGRQLAKGKQHAQDSAHSQHLRWPACDTWKIVEESRERGVRVSSCDHEDKGNRL